MQTHGKNVYDGSVKKKNEKRMLSVILEKCNNRINKYKIVGEIKFIRISAKPGI